MFYTTEVSKALRFGDVLRGYFSTTPIVEEPAFEEPFEKCKIDVDFPAYSVVMDPCCEIGHKMISLTPLLPVRGKFFDNPFFEEDLTRINRKMKPEQTVPPDVWGKLPPEEKQTRLAEELAYAFLGLFVYERHDLLPKYTIRRKAGDVETNYYMISLRNTYKLSCGKIISPEKAPLKSKVLELSIETRQELRYKVAAYFSRVPAEDEAKED